MNTSITAKQKKQYVRFGKDAFEKALTEAGLDEDGIQKLIEGSDEFEADIIASIRKLSVSNQFADEETESNFGYLSGYTPNRDQMIEVIIADFEKQIELLDKFFNCGKKFNPDYIIRIHSTCPTWVEKFFANFDWRIIASTYGEAVQKVFDLLKKTRDGEFYNYREDRLGSEYLRQSQKSIKAWEKFGDEQKDHNILIVPAQFGLRYRGLSVRRARVVMNAQEFGLGAFDIGIMLLTHPERLQHYDDLYIDCAGDEYSPDADGNFPGAPIFYFSLGQAGFDTDWVGGADSRYSSASGLVVRPQ